MADLDESVENSVYPKKFGTKAWLFLFGHWWIQLTS